MSVRVASTVCGVAGCILLAAGMTAKAADMATKAPAPSSGCAQAVDGINGKLAGFGGSFANEAIYGGMGSVALRLIWASSSRRLFASAFRFAFS